MDNEHGTEDLLIIEIENAANVEQSQKLFSLFFKLEIKVHPVLNKVKSYFLFLGERQSATP